VKLNWFSPLPPTRSEIARQTINLLPLLAQKAEVVVWSSETQWHPEAGTHATVRHYDADRPPWLEISKADVTFYQMGNDPRYHHAIWRISQQHPGIVILHDLKLQHFFFGLVLYELGLNRRQYLELVERHYGARGRVLAESLMHGLLGIEALAEQCPLTAGVTENALAVIVHSAAAHLSLSEETSVAYLPLGVGAPPPVQEARPSPDPSDVEVYRISVFGFLGPNRRLPALLSTFSNFARRDRFRLDIYGTIEGEEKIHQLVARLGLNDLVTLHGFVHEDQLAEALRRTDLVVNMRYPSMGEASASQLHLWQYALPALVTRTAWYETLPENTVAFVRPEFEAEDIQAHLTAFLADPAKYRELGRNGRRHVTENHSIETYANSLLEVAARVPEFQARWIARDLARRAGAAMNAWCDSSTIDAFLPRVAQEISTLVAGNPLAASTGDVAATSTGLAKSG
jgi:glycosyltransferase involved in cell wall biosynthesis